MPTGENESDPNLLRVSFANWFLCGWNTYRRNLGRLVLGSLLVTGSEVIFALLPGGGLLSAIVEVVPGLVDRSGSRSCAL